MACRKEQPSIDFQYNVTMNQLYTLASKIFPSRNHICRENHADNINYEFSFTGCLKECRITNHTRGKCVRLFDPFIFPQNLFTEILKEHGDKFLSTYQQNAYGEYRTYSINFISNKHLDTLRISSVISTSLAQKSDMDVKVLLTVMS